VASLGANPAKQDGNNAFIGRTSFPAASQTPQTINATTSTITCSATRVKISSSSTPYTLSGVATIADASRDGEVCIVHNAGSANITLTDGATQNLALSAATKVILPGQGLPLIWDSTSSLWTEFVDASGGTTSGSQQIAFGGSATTYTNTTEPATGVAPAFSWTIPAGTFTATGDTVECRWIIQQFSTDGTHAGTANFRIYVNGTLFGATIPDSNGLWSSTKADMHLQRIAGANLFIQTGTVGSSGTVGAGAGAMTSPSLLADVTIEIRPWMTTIPYYACWTK
jgi:hypothetical protein